MAPTTEHEHIALPKNITLVRDHEGFQSLLIDGETFPLPFAVDYDNGPTVRMRGGYPPAVTLTLLAETVAVTDLSYEPVEQEPTRAPVEVRTPADLREPLP